MNLTKEKLSINMSRVNDDRSDSYEFSDTRNVSASSSAVTRESLNESPILGHHFEMPDFSESPSPDPPKLDDSLPYIPVYTHLTTHDLVAIERPNTPTFIKLMRKTLNAEHSDSSARTPKTSDRNNQHDRTIHFSDKSILWH